MEEGGTSQLNQLQQQQKCPISRWQELKNVLGLPGADASNVGQHGSSKLQESDQSSASEAVSRDVNPGLQQQAILHDQVQAEVAGMLKRWAEFNIEEKEGHLDAISSAKGAADEILRRVETQEQQEQLMVSAAGRITSCHFSMQQQLQRGGDGCWADSNCSCLLLHGSNPSCDISQLTDASVQVVAWDSCQPHTPLHHLRLQHGRQLQQQRSYPTAAGSVALKRMHQYRADPKLSGGKLQHGICLSATPPRAIAGCPTTTSEGVDGGPLVQGRHHVTASAANNTAGRWLPRGSQGGYGSRTAQVHGSARRSTSINSSTRQPQGPQPCAGLQTYPGEAALVLAGSAATTAEKELLLLQELQQDLAAVARHKMLRRWQLAAADVAVDKARARPMARLLRYSLALLHSCTRSGRSCPEHGFAGDDPGCRWQEMTPKELLQWQHECTAHAQHVQNRGRQVCLPVGINAFLLVSIT